jgi:hypothetical protein
MKLVLFLVPQVLALSYYLLRAHTPPPRPPGREQEPAEEGAGPAEQCRCGLTGGRTALECRRGPHAALLGTGPPHARFVVPGRSFGPPFLKKPFLKNPIPSIHTKGWQPQYQCVSHFGVADPCPPQAARISGAGLTATQRDPSLPQGLARSVRWVMWGLSAGSCGAELVAVQQQAHAGVRSIWPLPADPSLLAGLSGGLPAAPAPGSCPAPAVAAVRATMSSLTHLTLMQVRLACQLPRHSPCSRPAASPAAYKNPLPCMCAAAHHQAPGAALVSGVPWVPTGGGTHTAPLYLKPSTQLLSTVLCPAHAVATGVTSAAASRRTWPP